MRLSLLAVLGVAALPAQADISVRFLEGAPKDRFIFASDDTCATGPVVLSLDLSGSSAGLVFDITGGGAGVEVFQPFELVSGAEVVTAVSPVTDGDTALSLEVARMEPGQTIAFTIDLDDTIGAREITVSGSEIAGVEAQVTIAGVTLSAPFQANGVATIPYSACLS